MNIDTQIVDPSYIKPLEIDLDKSNIFLMYLIDESTIAPFKQILEIFLNTFKNNHNVGLVLYISPAIKQEPVIEYLTHILTEQSYPEILVLNEPLNHQEKLELFMTCQNYIHLEKRVSQDLLEIMALEKTIFALNTAPLQKLAHQHLLYIFDFSSHFPENLFKHMIQKKLPPLKKQRSYIIQYFDRDKQLLTQFQSTQLIGLYAWGASGSNFVQTLFDSHPQILMFPINSLMNFHTQLWSEFSQIIHRPGFTHKKLVDACAKRLEPLFDGRLNPTQHQFDKLGVERQEYLWVDINIFKKALSDYLNLYSKHHLDVNRKVFFIMIHFAYAQAQGQEISQKLYIFHHLHIPENYLDMKLTYEDFPSMKLLITQRHLMASMHSNLKRGALYFSDDHSFENLIINGEFYKYYRHQILGTQNIHKRHPTPTCFIKLEELHKYPERKMKEISEWLEIKWNNCLLESTINGLKYWGSNLSKKPFSGFSKTHHQSKQWKEVFSLLDCYTFAFLFTHHTNQYYFNRSSIRQLIGYLLVFKPTKLELKALWKAGLKKDTPAFKKIILNVLKRSVWSLEHLFGEEVHAIFKTEPYEYLEELSRKQTDFGSS